MAIDPEIYYRKYGPLVLRRCRALLHDEADAADAMQDVFVLLVRNKVRLTQDAPSSLLYRMATNVCLNRIRSGKKAAATNQELLSEIAQAKDLERRFVFRSLLSNLLKKESKSTAYIATLHYHDGMTLEEVARETGLSVSGVRKRLRNLKLKAEGNSDE